MNFALLEQSRLRAQALCDASKKQSERNRLGQFATPTELAFEIARYGVGLLSEEEEIKFLDPAVGTGSFFSALLRSADRQRILRAIGFEIDPLYGETARELWSKSGLDVQLQDFTKAKPQEVKNQRFNLVICNPPYVRHHHLSGDEKQRLRDAAYRATGAHINGLAGLYCYFLGIAHSWMAPNGVAGWLVPSEFMDVNYGAPVKDYLLSRVTLLRIHRFDPNDVQFGDALVSSAIVWFRNLSPPHDHSVDFTFGGTLNSPIQSRAIPSGDLRSEPKWTRLANGHRHTISTGAVLADLFTVKRGLATGANDFFILTPDEVKQRDLPKEFLVPILPSPRYLPCNEILSTEHGNPDLERKLFLLDCRLPEDQVKAHYPSLWSYFEGGRLAGISDGFLCNSRSPWYVQEIRTPPQFLCTYIGRGDTKTGRPFRFILNHSKATAANVYLLLYPKPALSVALKNNPGLARSIWQKLNEIDSMAILGEGRVYGGGLHKLEPSELANVPIGQITDLFESRWTPKKQQMILCERTP